jgi:hypothetical protein
MLNACCERLDIPVGTRDPKVIYQAQVGALNAGLAKIADALKAL